MNFERKTENTDVAFVKEYFDENSLIRNEEGHVTEIRLPELEGEEAAQMIMSLEKLGVFLTVTSNNNGVLEFVLTRPDAITTFMKHIANIQPNEKSNEETDVLHPDDVIAREWTTAELTELEEVDVSDVDTQEMYDEPYTEDTLDLIEQGAVRFYQGQSEEAETETPKKQNPRFATDGKLIRQNYIWDEGQLYHKSGEPISVSEHREILAQAKESDEALATACQIHEGLVRWIADKHRLELSKKADHLVDMDDLLQAGREGLIKALRRLELPEDENKAVTQTYLIEYIKGGMLAAVFRDKGGRVLKSPAHVHQTDFRAFRIDQKRQQEDHDFNEPDLIELRENTDFDAKKVRDLYQVIKQLPEEYDDENPEHQQDYYRPDNNLHEEDVEFSDQFENLASQDLKSVMSNVLGTLPPRQERVIRLRFFSGLTLDVVAEQFGVTRERIRQIEAKALRLLKHPSRSRKIRSFLDE